MSIIYQFKKVITSGSKNVRHSRSKNYRSHIFFIISHNITASMYQYCISCLLAHDILLYAKALADPIDSSLNLIIYADVEAIFKYLYSTIMA